ncbi:hypothetical protein [Streptomyces sp. NPDC001594]|uniref:hypothetical protein n=1 Tax=Streptomyces sp. NPDC001594 TaxID=3364590 RepID=UPI0036CBA440
MSRFQDRDLNLRKEGLRDFGALDAGMVEMGSGRPRCGLLLLLRLPGAAQVEHSCVRPAQLVAPETVVTREGG